MLTPGAPGDFDETFVAPWVSDMEWTQRAQKTLIKEYASNGSLKGSIRHYKGFFKEYTLNYGGLNIMI